MRNNSASSESKPLIYATHEPEYQTQPFAVASHENLIQ